MDKDISIERLLDTASPGMQMLLGGARLHDKTFGVSTARCFFVEKGGGYYLKVDRPGVLAEEAVMGEWLHHRGFAPRVVGYETGDRDFLLTERVKGENGIAPAHLAQPERLCDVQAEALRRLHSLDVPDCPSVDVTRRLAARALKGETVDRGHLVYGGFESPQEARGYVARHRHLLVDDVCIHGDPCLPNMILDGFAFSGFVDLGLAGRGDRDWDLYWALWSLEYNLGTDRLSQRFLDAYGAGAATAIKLKLCAAIAALCE